MAQKPSKNLDALRSQVALNPGENYVGAFLARSKIKWGWFFLVGPLVTLTMKQFQVMVTDQRIAFGRLSMFGKLAATDVFKLDEIADVSFKKGPLSYSIRFDLTNGRTLRLDANHKAMVSMEGFLFEPEMEEFLTNAVA